MRSRLFDWLFGKKPETANSQPIVTVGVSSDEWLEWMLDELDEKDRRKERIGSQP